MSERVILHVDLDAFFAAVEQRDRPELRGKPVIVGGGGPDERGVVSAASLRGAQVRRALGDAAADRGPAVPARRLRAGRRAQVPAGSREVMAILRRFTPQVEPISIDEAFLDVTGSRPLFGDGEAIGRTIKATIRDEVGPDGSVGVGDDQARGQDRLGPAQARRAGRRAAGRGGGVPRAAADLAAVGRRRARRPTALRDYGVMTIGDLAALPPDALVRRFGKHGASLVRPRARASTRIRWRPATRRSRSGTSTRSTSTPRTARSSSGRCSAWPRASRGGCGRAGSRRRRSTVKMRDSSFRTITRQTALDGPRRPDRADLRAAVELAPPRAPRPADPPAGRDGVELPGAGAARAVRRRRPATAADGGGAGPDPAQVRRAGR